MSDMLYMVYDTAIGDVTICADDRAVTRLYFGAYDPPDCYNEENIRLLDAIMELNKYCYGQMKNLDVRLNPEGDSFAKQVFDYVKTIPYGETKTYKEIAIAINEPDGVKEVIEVLASNPIPLFIPCHRVVGEKDDIGVYCGNIELKKRLINMEKANAARFKLLEM